MCGITAVLRVAEEQVPELRAQVLAMSKLQRHRGPDWSGIHLTKTAILAHERLGIMDPESGHQPLVSPDGQVVLTINGEIFNHKELRKELQDGFEFKTGSDCEVVIPLYLKYGADCVHHLRGQFAFVLVDLRDDSFLVARDPIGINPLYWGHSKEGHLWVTSEMKAIAQQCPKFSLFLPGHRLSSAAYDEQKPPERYFAPDWFTYDCSADEPLPSDQPDLEELRNTLIQAVKRRLMTNVPWGVLLSGGLDSSLIASIAVRLHRQMLAERQAGGEETEILGMGLAGKVHTFSIGLEGSPDLAAARGVADFLGTIHHEYKFTVQEGLDAVRDVIYHLETYDVTTVRASTPMYLMARKIRSLGIKMVLSGEGADEVFAGYLYFHKAPSARELHAETLRKLKDLHLYDCLRANKAPMSWGLEGRFPFLDVDWLARAYTLDPTCKMAGTHPDGPRMEKHILRAAFDDEADPWLPKDVLWRQKEQFSDGVGYSWIDGLKAHAAAAVSDRMLLTAGYKFPYNTPRTKEAYFVRDTFEHHYPQQASRETVVYEASIACSTAVAVAWDEEFKKVALASNGEQSGRAVSGVHKAAYDDVVLSSQGKQ